MHSIYSKLQIRPKFKSIASIIILLILIPSVLIVPDIFSQSENPQGTIQQPEFVEQEADGFLLIILDGVGRKIMHNPEFMPKLNQNRSQYSVVDVETGPLTLSATCVKELMTGVPNDIIDGLYNFNMKHPGGYDPWILAAEDQRYNVTMIGSYVMGNLYSANQNIRFYNTFKGHSDYYEGDQESIDIFNSVVQENSNNVISLHFSGPDKVGHTWGIEGEEYKKKINDIDNKVDEIINSLDGSWNVIITADHGMTATGTHGSAEEDTRDVSAFIKGPRIMTGMHDEIIHQRDLSALTLLMLDQPFPVQLHGRIPLEITKYSDEQKSQIDIWNLEAAYSRNAQIQNLEEGQIEPEQMSWETIPGDNIFIPNSHYIVTVFMWLGIVFSSLWIFIPQLSKNKSIVYEIVIFSGLISIFVFSQANLDYSAMIPRALGAACAVFLVTFSFSNSCETFESKNSSLLLTKLVTSPIIIPYLLLAIILITQDTSKSVVLGLMIWIIFYPIFHLFSDKKYPHQYRLSNGFYWLIAITCFTFSGLRVWFLLVPLLWLAIKSTHFYWVKNNSSSNTFASILLSLLVLISLFFVNSRITGSHLMSDLLKWGWSSDLISVTFSIFVLFTTNIIANRLTDTVISIKEYSVNFAFLKLTYLALIIQSSYYDRFIILLLFFGYINHLTPLVKVQSHYLKTHAFRLILPCHMLLIWGVWACMISMLLVPCILSLIGYLKQKINLTQFDLSNPRVMVAIAIVPWFTWILWWTLMGQVNGVQTCFEGICPHPRELDLGRVQIKGGYVGFRQNPATSWMVIMVSLPIVIFSTHLFYSLKRANLSMIPFMLCQILIILGCVNIVVFSANYPRLLFAATWNILFAFLQLGFALVAELLHNRIITSKSSFKIIT